MNRGAAHTGKGPWSTLVSYLAGIAVETLYTLGLAGIGVLIVLGFLLFAR
jgi:hypothetical protein